MLSFEYTKFAAYKFLILAALLFILFRILCFIFPYILSKTENRKWFYKYAPVTETIGWVLFLVWGVQFFMRNNQLYALGLFALMMIIIMAAMWFSKDLMASVVFKTSGKFRINDTVKVNDFSGKIKTLGNRTLELETETGETVYLPYSKVLSEVLVKTHQSESILNHTFRLQIRKQQPVKQLMDEIRSTILFLPWSSLKKEPQIKPLTEDKDNCEFEITIYSPENAYFYKIENKLKEKFLA